MAGRLLAPDDAGMQGNRNEVEIERLVARDIVQNGDVDKVPSVRGSAPPAPRS